MKKIINTQNTMSYSEFLRRVADAIDKSAPKSVKDMNALVSSVTKSMERERGKERERENKSHDFIFKNRLLKVFVSLDAFPNYKNWNVFIGEKVLKSDVQNTIFILLIMELESLERNL